MTEIVGGCLSQFHDDANSFELLLAYSDGREIGHVISREAGKRIAAEFANTFDEPHPEQNILSGWQDIRNAPRDGTVILLCGGAYGGHPFSGKWDLGSFEDADRPWLNVITNSRLYEHVPNMWMEIPSAALLAKEIPEGAPARAPLSGPHSAGTLGARTL